MSARIACTDDLGRALATHHDQAIVEPADTHALTSMSPPRRTWRAAAGLAVCARYALALLLAVTAAAKLVAGEQFVDALAGFGVLPRSLVDLAGSAVIVAEFALALWLVSGAGRTWALTATACLFAVFAGLVASAALGGVTGDCGCFGELGRSSIGPAAVARTLVFAALAASAAAVERRRAVYTFIEENSTC